MDAALTPDRRMPVTFNSPLETGVRAVAILVAAFPQSFDLQRLLAFEHLLVHTGDVGGPPSLHPPSPCVLPSFWSAEKLSSALCN